MKRTLYKKAGLWELSVPLRAPVRGIWRYATFAEAWGHLWRPGYPPGLPGEVKTVARSADPSNQGAEDLPDIDDGTAIGADAQDVVAPRGQPFPAQVPIRRWRWIAVGLAFFLMILLAILYWPSNRHSPVADSSIPTAAPLAPKPADAPVSPAGTSHAFIHANERSWITACVDGKRVFSKLFTAGNNADLDFVNRAVVRMGDAGPIEITVGGKPLGPLGQTGQVRIIELVPGAWHYLLGGEAEDCTVAKRY